MQSLQEIASLLLLIHDFYLKEAHGSDVLVALMTFIEDISLHDVVSVLDAERLRRASMRLGETQMDYELFYAWLRGVGRLVYHSEDVGGKRALHYLLTKFIMPIAARVERDSALHGRATPRPLPFYTEAALSALLAAEDFLYLWYLDVLQEVCHFLALSRMSDKPPAGPATRLHRGPVDDYRAGRRWGRR